MGRSMNARPHRPARAARGLGGVVAAAAVLLAGCAGLPSQEGRPESFVLQDTAGTRLAAAIDPLAAVHPGKSGIYPLVLATDAFAARVLLASAAERSIDAQYYIWHPDQTGMLLLESLWNAAGRGVRVRILLDDQNTRGFDDMLAALGARRNFEVRLYNPFATRGARFLSYLNEFERVNRRMHNKAFIADNRLAIVGGRNIGNEYFGAGSEIPFKDLDVLVAGAAVPEVSAEFDRYWNSASAYPVRRLLGEAPPDAVQRLEERFAAARADPESKKYLDAVRGTELLGRILERRLDIEWAGARLVADDPAKTLEPEPSEGQLLLGELLEGTGPRRSFDLVSPYFVPGEKGTAALEALARRGVRVRVLTNSLAATDVAIVHSGYAKRRCGLARAGVILYEMKPQVAADGTKEKRKAAASGSSAARLHAKTFAADGERIFVGSFNFDLRSALLNTEMGLVIESPPLAGRLGAMFDEIVPPNAYEVRALEAEPCLEWIERTPTGEVRHRTEPESSAVRRAWLEFLEMLPIDWLL